MSVFPTRVLLATDGTEGAARASQTALELADRTGSELHVVTVGETSVPPFYARTRNRAREEARPVLEEEIEKIVDAGGEVTQSHIRVGDAGKEIVSLVEELGIGMCVLGGREKGPVRRYFEGDVPEYVFRYALCPVLVVHARESEGGS